MGIVFIHKKLFTFLACDCVYGLISPSLEDKIGKFHSHKVLC